MEKTRVHAYFMQLVQDRIDAFSDRIEELALDAANDVKSSAGDKHETGRSMLQLEQEKLGAKIAEYQGQLACLKQINPNEGHAVIGVGSLVQLPSFWVYLGGALPKIEMGKQSIFGVSLQAPVAQQLLGKKQGDSIELNGKQQAILVVS